MINTDNYEAYLYLYHEGELDANSRTEVEAFLAAHPQIAQEMQQYYDPTTMVTPPQKVAEYRRTPSWRWAAAACVLLAVGSGVWLLHPSTPCSSLSTAPLTANRPAVCTPTVSPRSEATHVAAIHSQQSVAHVAKQPTAWVETPPTDTLPNVMDCPAPEQEIIKEPLMPETQVILTDQLAIVDNILYVDNLADEVPCTDSRRLIRPTTLYQEWAKATAQRLQNRGRFIREELLAFAENINN